MKVLCPLWVLLQDSSSPSDLPPSLNVRKNSVNQSVSKTEGQSPDTENVPRLLKDTGQPACRGWVQRWLRTLRLAPLVMEDLLAGQTREPWVPEA